MKAIKVLQNIDKIRDREYSIAFKDGWNSFSNENKQKCDFTIRHKEVVRFTNDNFINEAIEELKSLNIIVEDKRTLKDDVFTNCNDCINKIDNKFTSACFGCKRYYSCRFKKKD